MYVVKIFKDSWLDNLLLTRKSGIVSTTALLRVLRCLIGGYDDSLIVGKWLMMELVPRAKMKEENRISESTQIDWKKSLRGEKALILRRPRPNYLGCNQHKQGPGPNWLLRIENPICSIYRINFSLKSRPGVQLGVWAHIVKCCVCWLSDVKQVDVSIMFPASV